MRHSDGSHYSLLLLSLMSFTVIQSQQGMICVPIADLVGQPMREFYGHGNVKKMYGTLPVSGIGTKPWQTCPRLHQALLHEMVDIVQEQGEEVYIKVYNVFYIAKNTQKHTQQFWTHKSNVARYKTIKNKPPENAPWTILKHPTHIPSCAITLSAGTRCAIANAQDDHVSVYVFNTKKHRFDIVSIPKKHCMVDIPIDNRARINLFVDTVRAWAHQDSGVIPYVWGGCSFTTLYPDGQFITDTAPHMTTQEKIYAYPTVYQSIKTGLDCSGLISRAAQLCNIPYYCKNSATAAQVLTPLQRGEALHAGDLIWFPGHIIIIADLHNHTIIEARSYDHGYGKVHEITLAQQFEGIHTYADLLHAYYNKIPLRRRHKSGNIVQIIPQFVLYRLDSIFNALYKHATHSTGLS